MMCLVGQGREDKLDLRTGERPRDVTFTRDRLEYLKLWGPFWWVTIKPPLAPWSCFTQTTAPANHTHLRSSFAWTHSHTDLNHTLGVFFIGSQANSVSSYRLQPTTVWVHLKQEWHLVTQKEQWIDKTSAWCYWLTQNKACNHQIPIYLPSLLPFDPALWAYSLLHSLESCFPHFQLFCPSAIPRLSDQKQMMDLLVTEPP